MELTSKKSAGMRNIAPATAAAHELIEMHVNRQQMGENKKILILGLAAVYGTITEPESHILLGRAGELKRFVKLGLLMQIDLPPGLKAAPHFPHMHHFQLSEKGKQFVAHHLPHLAGYANANLHQFTYLHDHIARIEAAWRIRVQQYSGYVPERCLPDLASPFQKQHDGHLITHAGERIGLEVEAADWKCGDKLSKFVAQCFNSIMNERVRGVIVLVQNQTALEHYAKPFEAGREYHQVWVKESNKWVRKESSRTVITPELAARVTVDLIRTKQQILQEVEAPESVWMPSAELQAQEDFRLYYDDMQKAFGRSVATSS